MEIQEVPRPLRRGLREAPAPVDPQTPCDLDVGPEALLDGLDGLADIRSALQVPFAVEEAEARAFAITDPNASMTVATLLLPLKKAPQLAADSGVTADDLRTAQDRLDGMASIYEEAQEGEARCEQSLRVMGKVQRDLREQVDQLLPRLLSGAELSNDDKRDLQREVRAIERDRAALAESRQAAAARTAAAQDQADAAVAEEQRREDLLRTMIKLKRGGSATPEELRRAYEELNNDERRGKSR